MKRTGLVAALVLGSVLGLVLVGRAQDDSHHDDKTAKKTYHLTAYVQGVSDTIELDDVIDPREQGKPGEFVTTTGSILFVPTDKLLAVLLEPMDAKKRTQDDKQPK